MIAPENLILYHSSTWTFASFETAVRGLRSASEHQKCVTVRPVVLAKWRLQRRTRSRYSAFGTWWQTATHGKWRGKMRMERVASSLALYVGTRSIQSLSADPHTSTASSWLNWHSRRFKWTLPFLWKAKSGFYACAITFRTCYTTWTVQ